MSIRVAAFALAATVAALCGTVAMSRHVYRIDQLTLRRTQCYGRCPAYTVTVLGDGRVTFAGEAYVAMHSANEVLPAAKMRALVHAINAARFLEFHDWYELLEDGCPTTWTDAPTVVLTLHYDGGQKAVHHYHGCRGTPRTPFSQPLPMVPSPSPGLPGIWGPVYERDYAFPFVLTALEDRIDEIVGTAEWVGRSVTNIPSVVLPASQVPINTSRPASPTRSETDRATAR